MPGGPTPTIRGVKLTQDELAVVVSLRDGTQRPEDITEERWARATSTVEDKVARAEVKWGELMRAVGCGLLQFACIVRDGLHATNDDGRAMWTVRDRFAKINADMSMFTGRYRGKQVKETPTDTTPARRAAKRAAAGAADKSAEDLLGS